MRNSGAVRAACETDGARSHAQRVCASFSMGARGQYAVEINNVLPRVPARKVHDRLVFSRDHSEQYASAHELYFNSLPDISQFKRFGTMAYAHVDRQELLQLSESNMRG